MVNCSSPTAQTCVAHKVFRWRTIAKFTLTVPTMMLGQIQLPVISVIKEPHTTDQMGPYSTIQQQFCASLAPWQCPHFGSIQRAISPNALNQWLQNQLPVIIVSDASVQKDEQSGFMWIITNENTKLWQGQGLAPGPAEDMHSGHAEAFGILAALTFFCSYIACYDPLPDTTAIQCFCDHKHHQHNNKHSSVTQWYYGQWLWLTLGNQRDSVCMSTSPNALLPHQGTSGYKDKASPDPARTI